ncbi:receptor-like protein EIX1 [Lycium ferocissimum]|uniref:receptor-like protein EIX1 n=1 Tax=Lycium ferocissimum TaxID=112874 RepID=UPI0028150086|nr:receptor-like protein EIX1 [Lycium ferocissimum]
MMAININILLPHTQTLIILTLLFINSGNMKLTSCLDNLKVRCTKAEKDALLEFKEGLIDTSGRLSSWVGEECCEWRGVVCNNKTDRVVKLKLRSPSSNSFDYESSVYLHHYDLAGEINPSLLELKSLYHLDLSSNNFAGMKIPEFFGSFVKLRYLNLSNTGFAGSIPPHFGNLSSLIYLDLNGNFQLYANNLQWLSGLHSLNYLNLALVDLSKTANSWLQSLDAIPYLLELHLSACNLSSSFLEPQYNNLTSLLVLDLSYNPFSSISFCGLLNLRKLEYLDLSSNNISGTIPIELGNMTSLQTIALSANDFLRGQINIFENLCDLQELDISRNQFSGEISQLVDGFLRCNTSKLGKLNLAYNEIGGSLPSSIGSLKHLKRIKLSGISLVGTIPDSIGNLSLLEELSLSDNYMSGHIPATLGKLSKLVDIDIGSNSWSGVITEAHFTNLTNLKMLSINTILLPPSPSLVVNISAGWVPPFSLTQLFLAQCRVGPKFPTWIRNQNELELLAFILTEISDTVPDWFSIMATQLRRLYFRNNKMKGPIPFDIGEKHPHLTEFDLSYNSFNGTLPLSISKITSLDRFVVSNNNLSGEIPDFWCNFTQLFTIDLSNNSFRGHIPSSLWSLSSLGFLMLSNNRLVGDIPPGFQNFTMLITLALEYNQFSGKLPSWIGEKMQWLGVLSLRSNLLQGEIPKSLCNLTALHFLDVGSNNLSGNIPSCLGNLSSMISPPKYLGNSEGELTLSAKGEERLYTNINLLLMVGIDLSCNQLTGKIPDELTKLTRMITLNLSKNYLHGNIPKAIDKLSKLETLDLSRNELQGTIPASMISLTSLSHLNLSHNNLLGRIPTGNQFQTFNDPSIYIGNSNLCGVPLPNKCKDEEPAGHFSPGDNNNNKQVHGRDYGEMGFFISIGIGFVVGFWGVCATLIIKKSWRYAYFQFLDDIGRKLFVIFFVHMARLRRRME